MISPSANDVNGCTIMMATAARGGAEPESTEAFAGD